MEKKGPCDGLLRDGQARCADNQQHAPSRNEGRNKQKWQSDGEA